MKNNLSHNISEEQCSMWSWFLVHFCKIMISPGGFLFLFLFVCFVFFIFSKLAKKCPKWQNIHISGTIWLSFTVHLCKIMISPGVFSFFNWQKPYQRNCTSYDRDFWCACVKWCYLSRFFHFFKIPICWVKRAKNDPKLPVSVCHTLYLKSCRSYQGFW